jgi:inhibitor of cysteine peptidase
MRPLAWRAALLLGFLVLGNCNGEKMPTASTVEMDADDDGREVHLQMGQTLVVTLESNPSTGYRWEVAVNDAAILRPMGEPQFQPESAAIGAGGMEIFRFEAVGIGRTHLELIYRRPWEEGVEPLQTFTLRVVVR